MLLSRRIPLRDLIPFCRALRHSLSAGLSLHDVFRQQGRRGPLSIRPIASRIADELEQGESLAHALEEDRLAFPPLFIALSQVGEDTGNLPEVLNELERYLVMVQRLTRQFWSQITWPLIQFFLAIFVIAGMLFVLGIVSGVGNAPFDPLGIGTGPKGAITWLTICFGSLGLVFALYLVITQVLKQQGTVDEVLLRLPVIGPCLQALALMRFCLALHLTMETGMSIMAAVRLSFRATGNSAFIARTPRVLEALRAGDDLSVSLTLAGLFPEDFLHIVEVGEEGGRIHDVLHHQAEFYEEEASRRMTILAQAASWGVWLGVAGVIIFLIVSIMMSYLNLLNSFM